VSILFLTVAVVHTVARSRRQALPIWLVENDIAYIVFEKIVNLHRVQFSHISLVISC
jgi:hypothetical protein